MISYPNQVYQYLFQSLIQKKKVPGVENLLAVLNIKKNGEGQRLGHQKLDQDTSQREENGTQIPGIIPLTGLKLRMIQVIRLLIMIQNSRKNSWSNQDISKRQEIGIYIVMRLRKIICLMATMIVKIIYQVKNLNGKRNQD